MESVRKAMDVNYLGMISVIKAMLPLLKKTKGSRIINISSYAELSGGAALGPMLKPFKMWVCYPVKEPTHFPISKKKGV